MEQLNFPVGITLDGRGNVFVADANNNRVQEFDQTGNFVQIIGSAGSGDGQLNNPFGVAVDGSGNLFVVDTLNNRIVKFAPTPEPGGVALLVGIFTIGTSVLHRTRRKRKHSVLANWGLSTIKQ